MGGIDGMVVRVHWVLHSIYLVLGSVKEAMFAPRQVAKARLPPCRGAHRAVRLPCGVSCAPCVSFFLKV